MSGSDPPPKNHPSQTLIESDFMRLFVRHELALRAYARSILPTWNSVDDAIQEASVTMWQKFSQLDTEDGFLPWAKVIVRFKCLSLITKYRRDHCLFSDEMLRQIADEAEAIENEHVAEIRSSLKICLHEFSLPHQKLLLAPYLSGGQVKRIAQDCGKSVNALYKLLGRLRQKLSTCIESRMQAES